MASALLQSMGSEAILFSNMACPYAHRAMFALKLRPSVVKEQFIPTSNQLWSIEKVGMSADVLGMFPGKSPVDLQHLKAQYKASVNKSGEVPSLQVGSTVIRESEIVCEYLDSVSESKSHSLVPKDPLLASRVRLAMKVFNAVPPAVVALLKNQEPEADDALMQNLDSALRNFVETLDTESFCVGSTPTLADVHCAPFLHRFSVVLQHYREYDMFQRHSRLARVFKAVASLPEWKAVVKPADRSHAEATDESMIQMYELYANNNIWKDSDEGPKLAGRGTKRRRDSANGN
eukprot:TRINITY_DN58647_c0_g1_i1.p1 TRINITY_DN58647_c0_g1~~TRINITY_DN58647_c0_g1_i1.p1  ORF type:complete len:305 (-),score=38.84 TRINITY_DN58647_c0_g1_i1:163-1032(-)